MTNRMTESDKQVFNAAAGAAHVITKMVEKFGAMSGIQISGEENPPAVYVEWLHLGLKLKIVAMNGRPGMAIWDPPGEVTDDMYMKRLMDAKTIVGTVTGGNRVKR